MRGSCGLLLMLWWVPLPAQEDRKYSPQVVAKAESILAAAGLRRSGTSLQATRTAELSRTLAGLVRQQRELKRLHQQWQAVADKIAAQRSELQRLNAQYGELNLQLANVAGVNVAANNRIVGLINATTARIKAISGEREQLGQQLTAARASLNQAEADYAETLLTLRGEFDAIGDEVAAALEDEQVVIALQVLHANYETPLQPTTEELLQTLDRRLERLEQEVFRESIPLDVERGSLFVDVVVGSKSMRMVVDSGASLVCLTVADAAELGISVPAEAPELRLSVADGRQIPARGVVIPRVRVGEFAAEQVEAAVLQDATVQAEPLLGMSFLGNFKFEIDAGEKTLTLLRVQTD